MFYPTPVCRFVRGFSSFAKGGFPGSVFPINLRCGGAILAAAGMLCGVAGLAVDVAAGQDVAVANGGKYAGHRVYRLIPHQFSDVRVAETLAEVVWSCQPSMGYGVDVQIAPERRAAFEAWATERELEYRVLIEDVQLLIERTEAENVAALRGAGVFVPRADDWYLSYKDLAGVQAKMDELVAGSNGDAQVVVLGNSLEGREIRGLKFSAPDRPGNPRSGRPQLMFEGMQHAREWVTPPTTLYIAEQLLTLRSTDEGVAALMDTFEFIVVPVINVDGYAFTWASTDNRLWRKNRRNNNNGTFGVDLNRNWGYEWGGLGTSTNTNSDVYRGPTPFSEPETTVLRNYITSLPRLRGHIDFHSFGQLVLSPYGYSSLIPPDSALLDSLNTTLTGALAVPHGSTYVGGPSFVAIYPASGAAPDWVYGDRNVLAWTIELRDTGATGFVLPPAQILPTAQESWEGVRVLAQRLTPQVLWTLRYDHEGYPVAGQGAGVNISIRPSGSGAAVQSGGVVMEVRDVADGEDGVWVPRVMNDAGRNFYSAQLPARGAGEGVELRFRTTLSDGSVMEYQPPNNTLRWMERVDVFADSFETDRGWTVGPDTATAGRWERADPQTTAQQPGDDVSEPGTLCYVTGAAAGAQAGSFDVDGGATVLTSPLFDALPEDILLYSVPATRVEFWRWSATNGGNARGPDTFAAEVSADGGATWVRVQTVTDNYLRWVPVSFVIEDFVAPSAAMRVRFISTDAAEGSICEAAVDEVRITRLQARRNADVNRDGGVDGSDVEAFFLLWQTGDARTDFNEDGGVDGGDVETFYYVWSRG